MADAGYNHDREGIPIKIERDADYYIDDGNITILVESTLFKVLLDTHQIDYLPDYISVSSSGSSLHLEERLFHFWYHVFSTVFGGRE